MNNDKYILIKTPEDMAKYGPKQKGDQADYGGNEWQDLIASVGQPFLEGYVYRRPIVAGGETSAPVLTDEQKEAERNPPAFPCPDTERNFFQPGMELRDWFAGQVVPSLIGGWEDAGPANEVARLAYSVADAMLKERMKKQKEVLK